MNISVRSSTTPDLHFRCMQPCRFPQNPIDTEQTATSTTSAQMWIVVPFVSHTLYLWVHISHIWILLWASSPNPTAHCKMCEARNHRNSSTCIIKTPNHIKTALHCSRFTEVGFCFLLQIGKQRWEVGNPKVKWIRWRRGRERGRWWTEMQAKRWERQLVVAVHQLLNAALTEVNFFSWPDASFNNLTSFNNCMAVV